MADGCSNSNVKNSSHSTSDGCGSSAKDGGSSQAYQELPETGPLADNLNWTLSNLEEQLRNDPESENQIHYYVVETVKMGGDGFRQTGSAPNLQGNCITLCTCKHWMRASKTINDGDWIAGFTSRNCGDQFGHALFYMMQIEEMFDSMYDMWQSLPSDVRDAKEASPANPFGDVYIPKDEVSDWSGEARYNADNYHSPPAEHPHAAPEQWENDIEYKKEQTGKNAQLLMGEPVRTFLWSEPLIESRGTDLEDGARGHRNAPTVSRLLDDLKSID
jgi:hypothetical protein